MAKKDLDEFFEITNMAIDMALNGDTKKYIEKLFEGKTPQEIRNLDPTAEWQKLMGGKNYKENSDLENLSMLGFIAVFNGMKKKVMIQAKETHIGMSYQEFLDLMQAEGFKVGYTGQYVDQWGGTQTEHILYAEDIGCVIYCNSFGKSLSGADVYGEIEPTGYKYQPGDEDKDPQVKRHVDGYNSLVSNGWINEPLESYVESMLVGSARPERSSGGPIQEHPGRYEYCLDLREGGRANIQRLRNNTKFARPAKQWKRKDAFLWFLNSKDEAQPGYDYKKISSEKLMKCPQAVRDIINDPERFNELDDENEI